MEDNTLMEKLHGFDIAVYTAIKEEEERIENGINLIASESYPIPEVLAANGSVLVSKYSEGYPAKRYYGGCENVDRIEELAQIRALAMFRAEEKYAANVQPHAGSQANMAVYMAALELGDTVLAMDLSNGGHLTHGSNVNFSGKLYNFVHYGVNEEGFIDYEEVRRLALEHKPKLIVCGASAYSRTIHFNTFKEIADEVGALLMADVSHIAGLIVANLHPSPVGYADFITTTTHKTLLGTRGAIILCKKDWEKKINSSVFPNMQGGALQHIIAGKAVSFRYAMSYSFTHIMRHIVVNAEAMADEFMKNGIKVVSGGTDNHLLLLDLTDLNITGKAAEQLLESVGIACNKNTIPNETRSPFVTSGIRLGTVSVTQRGFRVADCRLLAIVISSLLKNPTDEGTIDMAKGVVEMLVEQHSVYPDTEE